MLAMMLWPDVQTVPSIQEKKNAVILIRYIQSKENFSFLVSCCAEVRVTTNNSDVAAEFIGTYVTTTSEALVNGRVVYRKTANNREQCIWFGGDYWVIFYCTSLGGGGG